MSIRCAFLFPGQGSQAVGMGRDFFENSQLAKDIFRDADRSSGIEFEELLFNEESKDKLSQTEFTQPAILLVSSIAHRLFLDEIDIKPALTLGHSLGEFSALVASNGLELNDAISLVNLRGKLMAYACRDKEVGMLVVLGLGDDIIENICQTQRDNGKEVWAVNYNTDGQIVIAGVKKDLEELVPILKGERAKRAMLLNMSVASHCPLLESAVEPLKDKLEEVIRDDFTSPVISNVTASKYSTRDEALELLPQQLIMPVKYKQSIKNIDDEVDCYIEFGHGNILKGLNRKLTKKPHFNVSDMKSLQATVKALKEL